MTRCSSYGSSEIHSAEVSSERFRCQRTVSSVPQPRTKPNRKQPAAVAAGPSLAFGERLRKARTDQGLTLRDLSATSNISIAYLSDLERGALVNPTLDTLRAVAKALNVSLNELLGVDDQGERRFRYPKALEEFRYLSSFREVIAHEAAKTSRDPEDLEEEWLRALAGIQVAGRRPKTASDYFFVFEAIRRAVERR